MTESTPVQIVEPSPSSPITPILNRQDLVIKVLNGRGKMGAAKEAEEYLAKLGYINISAANASSFDYLKTTISIKQDKQNYLDLLTKDLSSRYLLTDQLNILDQAENVDVIITIGKE